MDDLSELDDEQVQEIYAEVRESFKVSMTAEGVGEETIEQICATVDDAVGNHL